MKRIIEKIKGGDKKGKKVLIIAGVHGDELTPIYTLSYMLKNKLFNIDRVKSITIMNGINSSGIKSTTREISSNNTTDLNRMLSTESKVDMIGELKEHINKNDIVIDIHSSPSCTEFALVDVDEYTNCIKKWCDKSNVITTFRYSKANTIKRFCLESNKPAVTLEFNKMDMVDMDSIDRCVEVINNLLKKSKKVSIEKSEPKGIKVMEEVNTYKSGIFIPTAGNGDILNEGDTFGIVKDYYLNDILEIKADKKVQVITTPFKSFVNRGEVLFLVQPI